MRFYFNLDENICAEEDWVVEHILNKYPGCFTSLEIRCGLHTNWFYNGWCECQVSNTIAEKFMY